MRHMNTIVWLALCSALVSGCKPHNKANPSPTSSDSAPVPSASTSPTASKASPATPPPRAEQELPKAQQVTIEAKDGFPLHASFWRSETPKAPALLLAHSLGADRHEWDPILRRLNPNKRKVTVLAVDLRGHGQSTGTKRKTTWQSLPASSFTRFGSDMNRVISWLQKRPEGAPSSIVLVGSDIGSSALVVAADKHRTGPCVVGAVLVSPGAKLRGIDVYHPFRALMNKPVLLVASKGDTISNDPVRILRKMGQKAKVTQVEGSAHGLRFLGGPQVWDSVAYWVEETLTKGCAQAKPASSAKPTGSTRP